MSGALDADVAPTRHASQSPGPSGASEQGRADLVVEGVQLLGVCAEEGDRAEVTLDGVGVADDMVRLDVAAGKLVVTGLVQPLGRSMQLSWQLRGPAAAVQ